MSFTERDFKLLSRENRIKKALFAVNEYFQNNKEFDYIKKILLWLEEFENIKFGIINDDSLNNIYKELKNKLHLENPFLETDPFDNKNTKRKILSYDVMLDDIRSPFNVGSIFRSSECFGVNKIILTGITPSPDNNKKVLKTSRGVNVDSHYTAHPLKYLLKKKKEGINIFSLEKTINSKNISAINIKNPFILIAGNEEFGVSKKYLEISDEIIHINLLGVKNSLNVSVAVGIALFELSKKINF